MNLNIKFKNLILTFNQISQEASHRQVPTISYPHPHPSMINSWILTLHTSIILFLLRGTLVRRGASGARILLFLDQPGKIDFVLNFCKITLILKKFKKVLENSVKSCSFVGFSCNSHLSHRVNIIHAFWEHICNLGTIPQVYPPTIFRFEYSQQNRKNH